MSAIWLNSGEVNLIHAGESTRLSSASKGGAMFEQIVSPTLRRAPSFALPTAAEYGRAWRQDWDEAHTRCSFRYTKSCSQSLQHLTMTTLF